MIDLAGQSTTLSIIAAPVRAAELHRLKCKRCVQEVTTSPAAATAGVLYVNG